MKQVLDKKNLKNLVKTANNELLEGRLVIFPTETVYGLGGDATNDKAIREIYKIKKRPINNPIISHFQNLKQVNENAILDKNAKKLAEIYWPGPLTLILKKKKTSKISSLISNNSNLIACRIPKNPIALKLLKMFGRPIAAPSANISSKLSTTQINHIEKKIKNNIFFIDGGKCYLGLESTVIKAVSNKFFILRQGSISEDDIKRLNIKVQISKYNNKLLVSPGQKYKHYSPNLPMRINVKKVYKEEVLLNYGKNNLFSSIFQINLSPSGNLHEAAKNFYDYLHMLDNKKYKSIAVAPIPDIGIGKTINDRLKRAIINE